MNTQTMADIEAVGRGAYVESADENRMVPIIGYLHTGMEKECEDQHWRGAVTIVTRMDYLAPLFNEQAYSLAVEDLLNVEVPPRGKFIRTLMAEMNRLSSHLVWFGTQGLDMGAISVVFYGFREREIILDFYEMVTGLRMNHGYIIPGGVWQDLPDGWEPVCQNIVVAMRKRIDEYEELLSLNPIFLERTTGVAVLSREDAVAAGATGPIARASGIDWDLRRDMPYEVYDELEFEVPVAEAGDVYARYKLRMQEMRESCNLIDQVVDRMPSGDFKNMDPKITPPPRSELNRSMEAVIHHFKLVTQGYTVPAGETYAAVESPRGELGVMAMSDGGTSPYRLHVRDPSFVNLQTLAAMSTGGLIADLIAAIASVDPVMGGVDR
jgi:NADH-quinone oxidoreductase subunit D